MYQYPHVFKNNLIENQIMECGDVFKEKIKVLVIFIRELEIIVFMIRSNQKKNIINNDPFQTKIKSISINSNLKTKNG